jgi:lipooligosaccharide transport system permease protein
VTAAYTVPYAMRIAPPVVLGGRRAARLVERNMLSYRRMWPAFVTGAIEPMLFLFSLSVGLGGLIGRVPGPGGKTVDYAAFVAPGLLAAAAMNGAIIDATFGLFF